MISSRIFKVDIIIQEINEKLTLRLPFGNVGKEKRDGVSQKKAIEEGWL